MQAVVTETPAGPDELLVAQIGLWTSLFVLSTLLCNAPTIPHLLRATGLVEPSPVKLSIQAKAKRALLRYTAAAIQDLKQDEDEMLRWGGERWDGWVARYKSEGAGGQNFSLSECQRKGVWSAGACACHSPQSPAFYLSFTNPCMHSLCSCNRGVDWVAVARYVDLSQDIEPTVPLPAAPESQPPGGGSSRSGGGPEAVPLLQPQAAEVLGTSAAAAAAGGSGPLPGLGAGSSGSRQEEIDLEGPGWMQPRQGRGSAGSSGGSQAGVLGVLGLGRASGGGLRSSHKLLGASRTNLRQKWLPRSLTLTRGSGAGDWAGARAEGAPDGSGEAGGAVGAGAGPSSPRAAAAEAAGGPGGGRAGWESDWAAPGEGSDIEAPLLSPRGSPHQREFSSDSAGGERAPAHSVLGSSSTLSQPPMSSFDPFPHQRGGSMLAGGAGDDRGSSAGDFDAEVFFEPSRGRSIPAWQQESGGGGGGGRGGGAGAPGGAAGRQPGRQQRVLPGTKSAPAMETIIEVHGSTEVSYTPTQLKGCVVGCRDALWGGAQRPPVVCTQGEPAGLPCRAKTQEETQIAVVVLLPVVGAIDTRWDLILKP